MSDQHFTRRELLHGMVGAAATIAGAATAGRAVMLSGAGALGHLLAGCGGSQGGGDQPLGGFEGNRYVRRLGGKTYRVYFGDLHVHSILSPDVVYKDDTPDALYQYAIETARLDFVAMTDHDCPPGLDTDSGEEWAAACAAAKNYHRPGSFVTYPAYEWSSGNGLTTLNDFLAGKDRWAYQNDPTLFGHRNVYFPSDNVPKRVFAVNHEESNTPEKLWARLDPFGAITIPHHPLGGPVPPLKWEHRNPAREPLVELYSLHGNSEADECSLRVYNSYLNGKHSVQHALGTGYRLGFIGGSDSHRGHAANPTYDDEDMILLLLDFYKGVKAAGGGLTAVYAETLTREAIWEALLARRTYATTGERMVVDLSIDGQPMGSELRASHGVKLRARVVGTRPLGKLELVKQGQVARTWTGTSEDQTVEYEDAATAAGDVYFYLRATQADGEMAWSSPVWVEYR
jgi:hypothetical protein